MLESIFIQLVHLIMCKTSIPENVSGKLKLKKWISIIYLKETKATFQGNKYIPANPTRNMLSMTLS